MALKNRVILKSGVDGGNRNYLITVFTRNEQGSGELSKIIKELVESIKIKIFNSKSRSDVFPFNFKV